MAFANPRPLCVCPCRQFQSLDVVRSEILLMVSPHVFLAIQRSSMKTEIQHQGSSMSPGRRVHGATGHFTCKMLLFKEMPVVLFALAFPCGSATNESGHTMVTTTGVYKPRTNGSRGSTTLETSYMTAMTAIDRHRLDVKDCNVSTTTATAYITVTLTTDVCKSGMNSNNGGTTAVTGYMTMMTIMDRYKLDVNSGILDITTANGLSHMTLGIAPDMLAPGMKGSTTNETSHMTMVTITDMYKIGEKILFRVSLQLEPMATTIWLAILISAGSASVLSELRKACSSCCF